MLAAFEQSGESVEKFCAKGRIAVRALKWWRWRLGTSRRSAPLTRRESVRIVPVDLIGLASAPPTAVRIGLSDMELRVEVGTDLGYVGALVGALRARC